MMPPVAGVAPEPAAGGRQRSNAPRPIAPNPSLRTPAGPSPDGHPPSAGQSLRVLRIASGSEPRVRWPASLTSGCPMPVGGRRRPSLLVRRLHLGTGSLVRGGRTADRCSSKAHPLSGGGSAPPLAPLTRHRLHRSDGDPPASGLRPRRGTPAPLACARSPAVGAARGAGRARTARRPAARAVLSLAAGARRAGSRPVGHPGTLPAHRSRPASPIRAGTRRSAPGVQGRFFERNSGGVLLSQGVYPQVPSALAGLTAVFGMGTGVTPPPWPPETCCQLGATRWRRPHEDSRASTSIVHPSPRPISTGRLSTLLCVHLRPINVVVWPRALPG